MSAVPLSTLATSRCWQDNFLAILPTVQSHASVSFRNLDPEAKAEATAHAVAAACVSYRTLARQRKLDCGYPSRVATYAIKSVRGGRNVGGHQNSRDVMSPLAQKRRGIAVGSLNPWDRFQGEWRNLVLETRRVSPADQAAFNLDFQAWLLTWSHRDRRIIYQLAAGNRTFAVARQFRISPGRVSQLRRRFEQSWLEFQGVMCVRGQGLSPRSYAKPTAQTPLQV